MKKLENPSKILSHNLKNRLHNFNENLRRKSFVCHNQEDYDSFHRIQSSNVVSAKSNHRIIALRQPDQMAMMLTTMNNDDSIFIHQQPKHQIILQPQQLAIMRANYQQQQQQPSMKIIDNNQNDDNGSQQKLINSQLSLDMKRKPILSRLLWLIFAIIGFITLLISLAILFSPESVVLEGFAKQLDVTDSSAVLDAW